MLEVDFGVKVKGLFKLDVHNSQGEVVRTTGLFPNIVLDQGLELLGTSGALGFCAVGSGVSTPSKTDVGLETELARTSNHPLEFRRALFGVNHEEGYVWSRHVFRFEQGQVVGNVSEVGVGGSNKLFNRALVRDSQGLFATVTVMEDETLDVTVELRSYLDTVARQYKVNISGTEYTLRTEPIFEPFDTPFASAVFTRDAAGYSGPIRSRTARPEGTVGGWTGPSANTTIKPYVPDSKEMVFEFYWGLSAGNSAPLRTVVIPTSVGNYQTEFDPVIPKTSDDVLGLTFKVTWDRYE